MPSPQLAMPITTQPAATASRIQPGNEPGSSPGRPATRRPATAAITARMKEWTEVGISRTRSSLLRAPGRMGAATEALYCAIGVPRAAPPGTGTADGSCGASRGSSNNR